MIELEEKYSNSSKSIENLRKSLAEKDIIGEENKKYQLNEENESIKTLKIEYEKKLLSKDEYIENFQNEIEDLKLNNSR
jgi:hypothetical protein